MFLSPLNWHYAKFSSFAWKSGTPVDVAENGPARAPDEPLERPASPASADEARPVAVEER